MKRSLAILSLVVFLALAFPVSAFAGGFQDGRVVLGGTYTLHSEETLNGDLAVFGGVATLETGSRVTGSVFVLGGALEADGVIDGDLAVVGGNANLGPEAVVRGDVFTLGGNVNPGSARIEGDFVSGENLEIPMDLEFDDFNFNFTRDFDMPFRGFQVSFEARVLGYLFQSFMLAGLAVLVAMLWPTQTGRVARAVVDQPVVAGGLGILTAIVAPVLLLVLLITICGSPLSLLGAILLIAGGIFGWIAIGMEVGRRLNKALNQDFQPVVEAGLGTLVFALVVLGFGFVPCVGWIASALVSSIGLGGVILTRFGARAYAPGVGEVTAPDVEALIEVPPPDAPEVDESEEGQEESSS
jgi:hypothetical protein